MQEGDSKSTGPAGVGTTAWHGARGRGVLLLTAVSLLLLTVYAAMGFLWAPSAVERGLTRTAAEAAQSELSIGQVRVDPFRRVVVLDDVRLSDTDSEDVLTVQRVEYRLRVRSLLGARRVLDAVVLDQPQMILGTHRRTGSAMNDPMPMPMPMRMLAALIEAKPFRVERLDIHDGEISVHHRVDGVEHVAVYAGISLTARSIDSGDASAPAHYLLEIAQAQGARLTLEGAVRMRPATAGQPALEVLSSRGAVRALRLPVMPGLLLITPVAEIEELVGTLRQPGGRLEAALQLRIPEAVLRDEDSVALALSQLEGVLEVGASAHAGVELTLQGGSALARRFSLSSSYGTVAASPATTLTLHDVPASSLSLMLENVVGRRISAGRATIALQNADAGRDAGQRVTLDIVASNVVLVPEPRAGLPEHGFDAELLLALLEDARGEVRFAIPLDLSPAIGVSAAVAQALREHASESVAAPAAALGRLLALPGPPPMAVRFEPGAAALTPAATETLSELAEVLALRPRLGVAVPARIDTQLDRDALARQQVELHVTLATARTAFRARPQPVDFTSARAQDVLDEFAAERLPADELAAIAAQHERDGPPEARAPYYRAVFAAVVDRERIERGALERIGRFRAQSIADALTGLGVPTDSVEVGEDVTAESSDIGQVTVPVELRLRVHSPQQH